MDPAVQSVDQVTERVVEAFIDLIQERKAAGKRELAATMDTIARWLSERTGLSIRPRHVQILTTAMREAGLITVGGGGIGRPNTYDTTEAAMGTEAFWQQVDAFLTVWKHPGRKAMLPGR
jgi:hypothetical protein